MKNYAPDENMISCVYGPPDDFTGNIDPGDDLKDEFSFLDKLKELFRRLIEFIKSLFA